MISCLVVAIATMGMGLLTAPEASANTAYVRALNLRIDGLSQMIGKGNPALVSKLADVQRQLTAMEKARLKCHPNGCSVETKSKSRNTMSGVKRTARRVKAWCRYERKLKPVCDDVKDILEIVKEIENGISELRGDHEKIFSNQEKILAKLTELNGSGGCDALFKYLATSSDTDTKKIIASTIRTNFKLCVPDRGKIALALIEKGCGGIVTKGIILVDPCNNKRAQLADIRRAKLSKLELELMEDFSTGTTDIFMALMPIPVGAILGFAIGELAHPELLVTNGDDPRFEESAAFSGMLFGAGAGALVTLIYFATRPSAKQRTRQYIRSADRRSRAKELSSYEAPDGVTIRSAGVFNPRGGGFGFGLGGTF